MTWQKGIIISIKPSYTFKAHISSSALKAESAPFGDPHARAQQLSQPHAGGNKLATKPMYREIMQRLHVFQSD